MSPFYSKTYEVGSNLIDQNFDMRLPLLLGYMQEVAEQHSASLNIAWEDLQKKNCFWTLYRIGLQIEEMPHWHDEITITTWANPSDNLIQPRAFEIKNQQKTLIRATTLWTVLDTRLFKPQKVYEIIGSDLPTHRIENGFPSINLKIPKIFTNQLTPKCHREVLFSDIDTNKHVNNTRYVCWLLDSYPIDFLNANTLQSIIINYTMQAHIGDLYEIYTQINEQREHLSAIMKQGTQEEFCKIKTTWRARK